ncbi:MAG: hypothetical protein HDR01_04240 [Lachnospiraceae bacterium]|nr:hypothetical protein [Lachnospiraceae bacterium]
MAKLVVGVNDLETWCKNNYREDLLEEWDYISNKGLKNKLGADVSMPNLVMPNSNIKVGWICNKGHKYEAAIGNRTVINRGCPYCSGSKLLIGYNDFETWCKNNSREDLLEEWNYKKNNGLKPSEILQGGAGKKYWWIGACGHEWDAVISSRITVRQGKTQLVKPAGCPYCSNPPKRILVGFNDLVSWCISNQRENLLTEWDYEKNDISPTEVTFGSGKYVWWKCNKNHEWKTQVHNRTEGSKTNCPICARTQTSFPEQAVAFYLRKEYDILQRYRIKGREVDIFIPKFNIAIEYDGLMWHSGKAKIKHDLEKTKKLVSEGITLIRLRETKDNTSINKENGQYVIEFVTINGKYVTTEFEWALNELYKVINTITNHNGIPIIDMKVDELQIRAHYMNVLKENSVASVFPELIEEWDVEKNEGITPDVFSARNNKKVWWKCSKGHSWLASINTRGEHKLGCPYCAGQRVIAGENDFESWCRDNNSVLLVEWDYEKNVVKPYEIPRTYKEKMHWKCSKGHEWEATVYNRVNGTGCPVCNNGNNVRRNKVSLAEWCSENNSSLCEEWNYEKNKDITPQSVTYGSHAKVWWKCSKGHEWEAQIKSRTYNHGCPFCSGTNKRAIKGVNDLETWCKQNDREYILDEWDEQQNEELAPDMVTWGSHKRIHWKCSKGHKWEAVVKERTKIRGNQCPICRKKL